MSSASMSRFRLTLDHVARLQDARSILRFSTIRSLAYRLTCYFRWHNGFVVNRLGHTKKEAPLTTHCYGHPTPAILIDPLLPIT